MNEQLHITLRHYGTLAFGGAVAIVLGFAILQHFAPPPAPVHGPVAVFTPKPVEKQVQSAVDSYEGYARIENAINRWQTIEQMAYGALTAATAERVRVSSHLHSDATPQPIPTASKHLDKSDLTAIYQVTRAATQSAMNDPGTHINTNVTIDHVEVQPGRVTTAVNSLGQAGIGLDVYRHGQYNVNIAGVKAGTHIAPMVSAQYILPHTKLGAGFGVIYDHKLEPVLTIGIHFGPQ